VPRALNINHTLHSSNYGISFLKQRAESELPNNLERKLARKKVEITNERFLKEKAA
jgi:hypothetical protein